MRRALGPAWAREGRGRRGGSLGLSRPAREGRQAAARRARRRRGRRSTRTRSAQRPAPPPPSPASAAAASRTFPLPRNSPSSYRGSAREKARGLMCVVLAPSLPAICSVHGPREVRPPTLPKKRMLARPLAFLSPAMARKSRYASSRASPTPACSKRPSSSTTFGRPGSSSSKSAVKSAFEDFFHVSSSAGGAGGCHGTGHEVDTRGGGGRAPRCVCCTAPPGAPSGGAAP